VNYIDHKPLTYAFSQKLDKCSPRQFNNLEFISQLTTDIRHISWQDNVVADALYRMEAVCASVSPEALAEEQANDAELAALLHGTTALRLENFPVPSSDVVIHCDTSAARPLPYVPATLRRHVFNTLQGIGHIETRATTKLTSQRFVWPGVQKDCRTWARACMSYQRLKISRHITTPWETSLCLHPGSSTFTSSSLAHSRYQMVSDTFLRQ